jgi:hypothetical protein
MIDKRSLAMFRIALAVTTLCDLTLVKWIDVPAFFSDDGVLPRDALLRHGFWQSGHYSLHLLSGSALFQRALVLVEIAFALLFALGFRTRLSNFALYVLTVSMHRRNPLLLHSGDDLHRLLLFFALFLPLGARFSIDSMQRNCVEAGRKLTATARRCHVVAGVPALALTVQVVCMYFFSVFHKRGDAWRRDSTATYYALQLDYYRTPIGEWMRHAPSALLCAFTAAVFAWELVGPLLLFVVPAAAWPRLRTLVALSGVALHAGFGFCMRLGTFVLFGIAAWTPFFPGELFGGGAPIVLRWPVKVSSESDRRRRIVVAMLATLTGDARVRVTIGSKIGNDDDDDIRRAIDSSWLRYTPVGVAWLFALAWLFDNVLSFDGGAGAAGRRRRRRPFRRVARDCAAAYALLVVVLWNVQALPADGPAGGCCTSLAMAPAIRVPLAVLGLEQEWSMFAPNPPSDVYFHSMPARLKGDVDGRWVELFVDGALWRREPAQIGQQILAPPRSYTDTYRSHPWVKFFEATIWHRHADTIRHLLAQYVCTRMPSVASLYIVVDWTDVLEHNARKHRETEVLFQHVC